MSDASSDERDLSQKHKKERKVLQAKIMNLKHSVPKGDKKKKKEILEQIAKLEAELDHQQDKESVGATTNEHSEVVDEVASSLQSLSTSHLVSPVTNVAQPKSERVSKAQRRRDKKAQQDHERNQRIAEQDEINLTGARTVEFEKIKSSLNERGLSIYEVPSDGDCLYAAIAHQLSTESISDCVRKLRRETASYMRENPDEFLPFMCDTEDGESHLADKFERYCQNIETTPAWGGQLELRAISEFLKLPIEVIQAEGVPVVIGNEHKKPPIILTYHRHAYGLGEHYNSVTASVPNVEDNFTEPSHAQ